MSITMSEYFSVSRSMQNANTAKYYFDGSILFCKIILGNWYRNIFSFFLDCGELDKHPIDYSAEDHLSRFSFSSPVSNCTSMFIDYRQLPTRSEIYCEKKRDEYLFQIQAKTPPHGWLNLFAQQQLFHLKNCVFCDSTFASFCRKAPFCLSTVWQQHGVSAWKPTPAFSKSVRWAFWPNFSWMWNCGTVELWAAQIGNSIGSAW